jgi:type I restriction enzyme S subunit
MGGKYWPYPAYKPSGVAWLGDIPKVWGTLRVKLAADFRNDKRSAKNSDAYVGLENVVPWVGEHTPTLEQDVDGLSLTFCDGDVLFGKLRPYLAKSWRASFDGVCSSEFLVMVSRCLEPKFLNYVTLTADFINQVDGSTYGSKMPRANSEFIGQLKIPYPSAIEATKIAAFLDRETAKIDALIAKQQRLIALLEEKRQAVISHAVTKGLDPTAPLRPSGIDWLGDVPAHWDLSLKFSYLTSNDRHTFVNGPFGSDLLSSELRKEGIPVIYSGDIRRNNFKKKSNSFVTAKKAESLEFCKVTGGDLLLAKVGAPPGVASIYPSDSPDGIVTQDVVKVDLDNLKASTKYLCFLLNSQSGEFLIRNISVESTRGRFSLGDLKAVRFFMPPVQEQIKITNFIEQQTNVFDEMMPKAQSAITLLKERRTALISAAVTGKIDLRGWQLPEGAADISTQDIEQNEEALA